MSFGIRLEDQVLTRFDESVLCGEIEINGYIEDFFAPTEFWSKEDYLRSWKKSLEQGLQGGGHAVLVTAMRNPEICNFIFYWVVYLEGEQAYIQNGVLFIEDIYKPFVPENINSYVSRREEIDEDGNVISQWKVDSVSVVDFFKKISN